MIELTSLLRRTLYAASLLLLLSSHLAASTIAADCLGRCRHSCCRASGADAAPGAHCDMAAHAAAGRCGFKARCTHTLEAAITALPLLIASGRPVLPPPVTAGLQHPRTGPRVLSRTPSIDSPPPRPSA